MALPSQTGSKQSRHSYTYRRGRSFNMGGRGGRGGRGSKRRPFFVAIVALLTITVAVWGFRAMRSPSEDGGPSPNEMADARMEMDRVETPPARLSDPVATDRGARRTVEQPRNEPAVESPRQAEKPPEQPSVRMGERTPATQTQQAQSQPGQQQPTHSPATQTQTTQTQPAPQEKPRETAGAPAASPTPPLARDSQPPPTGNAARDRANDRMRLGMDQMRSNRPIEARRTLTQALESGVLSRADAAAVRQALGELNDRLVFSPEIVTGDPFTYGYAVRPGDTLSRIAHRESLNVDWRLIQRINRINRPEQIRPGQNLKLVKGPFHAVVHKRDYRMDIYIGQARGPEAGGAEAGGRVFVRSFRVGLGEFDSTPAGTFRVRPNSKLLDPEWVNPRTGERFRSRDPKNPIGNRWIGLEGVSESVVDLAGYGIHGTIEPESIGTQASMGCIRLLPADVELVYELLAEGLSVIEVRE